MAVSCAARWWTLGALFEVFPLGAESFPMASAGLIFDEVSKTPACHASSIMQTSAGALAAAPAWSDRSKPAGAKHRFMKSWHQPSLYDR